MFLSKSIYPLSNKISLVLLIFFPFYKTEDPDSDAEDDIIKPGDNLVLVGHVQGDASVLEVYGEH